MALQKCLLGSALFGGLCTLGEGMWGAGRTGVLVCDAPASVDLKDLSACT